MSTTSWQGILVRTLRRLYRLLLYPIYLASGFMPRDPKLWVFGARNGKNIEGNPKWLYLYMARQQPAIRVVWITCRPEIVDMLRSAGLEAHLMISLRGLWVQLRARVFAFNINSSDINYWTSRGAFRVNLQHGTPFKRFGRDVINPANLQFSNYRGNVLQRFVLYLGSPSSFECVDLVVSASSTASERWAGAMGVARDRVIETGNPRTDVLMTSTYIPDTWDHHWYNILSSERTKGRRIISYLPTFRDGGAQDLHPIDWVKLDAFLLDSQMVLWYRKHPSDSRTDPPVENCANIYLIPGCTDLDPLLRITDLLITDYSSLYFDFLLLDRPIIFFAYDLEQYLAGGLSLYDCYNNVTPGPKITDFDELLACIKCGGDADVWSASRAQLQLQQHKYHDADACQRVYYAITERMLLWSNANSPVEPGS